MDLTEFSKGAAWSIMPETFDQLIRHYQEVRVNLSDDEKTVAISNANGSDGEPYLIQDGVAIIPVSGPLLKRPSLFSRIFGGSSYQEIGGMIQMAVADSRVRALMLNIDSPGGVVNGTEGLSDLIFNLRKQKPIIAYSDGNMTSAAYWIGSAAETIVVGPTSTLGSIGVLMIHSDYSEMDKKIGLKTTYITAGKYKALGNDSEPLTLEAKEYFQDRLNYLYSIFVDSVARNRDVETEKVLADMAEGRLFIGQQAVDVGLADRVGTMDSSIDLVRTMIDDNQYLIKAEENKMDIENAEQLAEAFPALVLEIQDGSKKSAEEQGKLALTEERNRIVDLVKIQFGEEKGESFSKLVHSDITPDIFRATKDLVDVEPKANDDQKAEILEQLKNSGADDVGAGGDGGGPEKDYMAVCREYQAEHKCSLLVAQREVTKMNPKLRQDYIKAVNS
jgi:signal peptide peptidase SppA